jgi:hypothetical protein
MPTWNFSFFIYNFFLRLYSGENPPKMNKTGTNSEETVKVIGAGWGRTGTLSLKAALEILGYDPTYHMFEVINRGHCDFWIKVADNQPYDFDDAFICENGKVKYTATCDFPSSKYWKEQLERYPSAKVILTIRDPEKWYKSGVDTIFKSTPTSPHYLFGLKVLSKLRLSPLTEEFLTKIVAKGEFHYDWSKENMMNAFKKHNERVKRECPPEKLLIFEVSQGWEPLCKFLGKPIPSVPFPHVNDTQSMQTMFYRLHYLGCAIFAGLVLLPVGVGMFAYSKFR